MKNILKNGVGLRARLIFVFTAVICIVIATAFISAGLLKTSFNHMQYDKIASAKDEGNPPLKTRHEINSALNRLRFQIAIAAMVLSLTLVGVGIYVDRTMVHRIIKTMTVADAVSQGHFHYTVPITINDEIGMIGQRINDVAMNTQECLMYMWNMSNRMGDSLKQGVSGSTSRGQSTYSIDAVHVQNINDALTEIRDTIHSFGLFGVVINEDKLMAAAPADRKQESPNQQDHMLDESFPLQRKVGSFPA